MQIEFENPSSAMRAKLAGAQIACNTCDYRLPNGRCAAYGLRAYAERDIANMAFYCKTYSYGVQKPR